MAPAEPLRQFLREVSGFLEKRTIVRDVGHSPPAELHLELTYSCNSSCVMCNLRHLRRKQKTPDLTLEEVRGCVENSSLLNELEYIILSGGEPWQNRDFAEIAVFFLNRYPAARVLILSNLTEIEPLLSQIREIETRAGTGRISVGSSIDGTAEVHDRIRGVKGAFEATVANSLMIGKKYPGLLPCFNYTLVPANSASLYDVYKWSRKTGLTVSYQAAVPKKEIAGVFKWKRSDIERYEEDVEGIIDHIWKTNKWESFNPGQLFENLDLFFFLLNFHYISKYIRKPERYFANCPCGQRYAMVNPEGGLYFCPVNKDMLGGNIREEGFDRIWRGNRAREIRDFFNRRECHCWLSCTNSTMLGDNFFKHRAELKKKFLPGG